MKIDAYGSAIKRSVSFTILFGSAAMIAEAKINGSPASESDVLDSVAGST